MIEFHYETDFKIENEKKFTDWLTRVINSEEATIGQLDYVFCTDEYLLDLNQKYLSHDTYTDIITFEYSAGRSLSGDIFISVDRVRDNAEILKVEFDEELLRVMSHGVLHLAGYKDKSDVEKAAMRLKENDKIKLFHVEQ